MNASNLLTPWLLLGGVLFLLVQAEKWIHSHLYGVGWLLTEDKQSATALYYLALLPGVFVHEVTQWLLAGALNVPTKRVMAWPEAQEDGTLRLDFVQVLKAGWFPSALIGAIPFITGTALIWLISNRILDLEHFLSSLSTGDLTVIGPALRQVGSTPDFYLWLYILFAISNAMIPTPADRKGWPLLIGLFAVCLGFLVLIGVGPRLYETFTGPVARALNLLTAAFSTVLVVEVGAVMIIGTTEQIARRLTKRTFTYAKPVPPIPAREPGSSLPLPPGVPPPSIYRLELPLPDPSAPAAASPRPAPQPAASAAPRTTEGFASSGSLPAQPGIRSAAGTPPGPAIGQPGTGSPREPLPGARPIPRPAANLSAESGEGNRLAAPRPDFQRTAPPTPGDSPVGPRDPVTGRPLPGTPPEHPQGPPRPVQGAPGAPERGLPGQRPSVSPPRSPADASAGGMPSPRPASPFSPSGSRVPAQPDAPRSDDPDTLRQPARPAPSGSGPFSSSRPFPRPAQPSNLKLGQDEDIEEEDDLDDLDDLDDDDELQYVDFDDV